MNYNLNIIKILRDLLPWFIKKSDEVVNWASGGDLWASGSDVWTYINSSTTLSYFLSILKGGISFTNNQFIKFRNDQLYKVNISGQVIYLEKYLNDLYDPLYRRIYIEDAALVLPPFIYAVTDGEPSTFVYANSDTTSAPFYLYSLNEYYANPEFIVYIPLVRIIYTNQIKSIINKYKLAAAKYKIITF